MYGQVRGSDMTTAQRAAFLVAVFEGCKLAAYPDPVLGWKVPTIAFGHTAGVKQGDTCTYDQAVAWMEQDDAPIINLVATRPVLEAGALVSFGHNCGIGSLLRVLAGDITVNHEEFLAHDQPFGEKSGGQHPMGLKARRNLEAADIELSRGISDS